MKKNWMIIQFFFTYEKYLDLWDGMMFVVDNTIMKMGNENKMLDAHCQSNQVRE